MAETATGAVEAVGVVLLSLGSLLMLLSAVGVVRMPDLYTRMSASSKAAGLGSGLVLAAVGLHFNDLGVTARAFAAIVFIFLTVPVAAHMLARSAYLARVPIWDRTIQDDLADKYDRGTDELHGRDGGGRP